MFLQLATLLAALFAGGPIDYFYIDKIEEGINKEVVDADRNKELQAELKEFAVTAKEFSKVQKEQMQELREKNLDRTINMYYYLEFFELRMQERVEFQKTAIEYRLALQENITLDEWHAIVNHQTP